MASYLPIPLPSSVHIYEGEWFYVRNLGGVCPCFSVAESLWTYGAEKRFRPKIDYMLAAIAKQRWHGLIGERLASLVLHAVLSLATCSLLEDDVAVHQRW
jgi:hypothetical protein